MIHDCHNPKTEDPKLSTVNEGDACGINLILMVSPVGGSADESRCSGASLFHMILNVSMAL